MKDLTNLVHFTPGWFLPCTNEVERLRSAEIWVSRGGCKEQKWRDISEMPTLSDEARAYAQKQADWMEAEREHLERLEIERLRGIAEHDQWLASLTVYTFQSLPDDLKTAKMWQRANRRVVRGSGAHGKVFHRGTYHLVYCVHDTEPFYLPSTLPVVLKTKSEWKKLGRVVVGPSAGTYRYYRNQETAVYAVDATEVRLHPYGRIA